MARLAGGLVVGRGCWDGVSCQVVAGGKMCGGPGCGDVRTTVGIGPGELDEVDVILGYSISATWSGWIILSWC